MGGNNTRPATTPPTDSKHRRSSPPLPGSGNRYSYVKRKKSFINQSSSNTSSEALISADSKSSRGGNQDFYDLIPERLKCSGVDVVKNIWAYAFDPAWLKPATLVSFFRSSLEQEILALAYYAAPLDVVERTVRRAYANKEKHLPATLVRATIVAIQHLDVTILDEKKEVIAEGMAERLMSLHEELHPEIFPQSLALVRASIPVESKEELDAREANNVAMVDQLFNAIKKNDKNTNAAIKNFEDFVKSTTQLNRLHLLSAAVDVLARRGEELTGELYGALADRICFEVIGLGIEMGFSPRMRKILENGVYYILNREKTSVQQLQARQLDIDGKTFIGVRGSVRELGVNYYFDACGVATAGVRSPNGRGRVFKTYYKLIHQRCELMQPSDTLSKTWIQALPNPGVIHRQF